MIVRGGPRLLLLGLLATPGCVTTAAEGDQLRSDMEQLKTEIAEMQKREADQRADVDKKLADMSARVEGVEGSLASLRQADADTGVQMEKVIAELQQLRGDVEEARYQLGETKKTVQDIIERPPVEVAMAEGAAPVEGEKTIAGEPVPDDKQALYDFGKKLFDEKKYADAQKAFELFVQRHPGDTDLADNAWFWRGEAHYAEAGGIEDQKKQADAYKQAILAYQKVLSIPKSNKADSALFKIALSFEALRYFDEAKVFYEEIISKYPKSSLIKEAKKRLRSVKGKSGKKKKRRRR